MAVMSARDFNQDLAAAKRTALHEPVVVTDRGQPAFVLVSIAEYRRLTRRSSRIRELLMADDEVDFTVTPLDITLQVPDL